MIKKWDNFINESFSDSQLLDIKDTLGEFQGNDKIKTLIKTPMISEIFEYILKYTEWRYDDISKEISNWYVEKFSKLEGWVGSTWQENLLSKQYGTQALILTNAIDFYIKVKDEFDDSGYPKISQLSKDMELIAVSTLDKIEFYEVYETHSYVYMRLGRDTELNVDELEILSDEIIPMCARIKDALNLKNESLTFDEEEAFGISLRFSRIS